MYWCTDHRQYETEPHKRANIALADFPKEREHERVPISRAAFDEIRHALVARARWGGVIGERVPELVMDGITLVPEHVD